MSVNEILQQYILKIEELQNKLPEKIASALSQSMSEEIYSKNSYLLNAGEVCKFVYIVKTGVVWKFYSHRGKKVPTEFAFPGDIIFSFQSYTTQIPSLEYIQTFEDSLIQKIEFGKFESLKFQSDILVQLDTLLLEYQILKLEDR